MAVRPNGELRLPECNLVPAVGSQPRIVPGLCALDARQSAPHPLRVRVPSDRLVRLRYPCEARGEVMKTDNLRVVHARAAGLDIHKMQITVSIRICAPAAANRRSKRGPSKRCRAASTRWLGGCSTRRSRPR